MKRLIFIALPVCFLIILACQKEYSFETGTNTPAAGTLKDSLGDCQPITINGTYTESQALNATNFVNVTVKVSSPGKYRIVTDTMNGYWFTDSGYFASAGDYVIKLKGGGSPILPISSKFTVTFNTSFCNFTIVAGASSSGNLNAADTAWMFNEGTSHFQGHIDSALFKTTGGITFLNIYGKPVTNDTTFYAQLQLSGSTPTGAYTTGSGTAVFEFKNPAGVTIYDSRQTDGSNLTFSVVNYNTTTKVLDATFTGTVKDGSGGTKTVTAGKLKLQAQ